MLVDDSIVRGTTSEQIVQMVRSAGAKKVFFCSASPAIRYANVYGIDMPVQAELIAFGRDEKEIARAISADWVVYQVSIGGDYTWFLFTLRLSSRDIFQSKMVTVWALIQINNFFHSGTR
jgi:hypothetical protein